MRRREAGLSRRREMGIRKSRFAGRRHRLDQGGRAAPDSRRHSRSRSGPGSRSRPPSPSSPHRTVLLGPEPRLPHAVNGAEILDQRPPLLNPFRMKTTQDRPFRVPIGPFVSRSALSCLDRRSESLCDSISCLFSSFLSRFVSFTMFPWLRHKVDP